MPGRKEIKETVTYPASKRKAPPFKPQRPSSTLPRVTSTGSSTSVATSRPTTAKTANLQRKRPNVTNNVDKFGSKKTKKAPLFLVDDSDCQEDTADEPDEESADELPGFQRPVVKEKTSQANAAASTVIHSLSDSSPPPEILEAIEDDDPGSNALLAVVDNDIAIPQPLLLRLMHESFANKDTKIDKHAIIVLQKYLEVFVRETVARAALSKKGDVEEGSASQTDVDWLDHKDLEKVAGGIMLDF